MIGFGLWWIGAAKFGKDNVERSRYSCRAFVSSLRRWFHRMAPAEWIEVSIWEHHLWHTPSSCETPEASRTFLNFSWSLDQSDEGDDDEDRSLADGFFHYSLRCVCRTDLGWFGFAGFQEGANWQPLCSARLECRRYIPMQLDKHSVHQARLRERDQFGVSVSEWEAFGKFREAAVVAGALSFQQQPLWKHSSGAWELHRPNPPAPRLEFVHGDHSLGDWEPHEVDWDWFGN